MAHNSLFMLTMTNVMFFAVVFEKVGGNSWSYIGVQHDVTIDAFPRDKNGGIHDTL